MTENLPKNEDQLQAKCVTWFNNNYCLKHHSPRSIIFSVPNSAVSNVGFGILGKLRELKCSAAVLKAVQFVISIFGNKMKSTGVLSGVSDLIIIHRSIVYFCELKTEKGYLSPSQHDFSARVTENGFQYKIFRSLLEFQEFFVNL